MTLPTLTVLLDNGTGTFPYNISSKVLFADGFSFNRGRADWQGGVTAGQLQLTLNNSDGRFTPGSTVIAAPSPIRVDQRIRVRETINGTTITRYTGYVKSWPVEWPATVGSFATTTITVVDAQARAERRPLRSMLEEEALEKGAVALYTLADLAGSLVAAESSGNQGTSLVMTGVGTDVIFGNGAGPGTDGNTAAEFTSATRFLVAPVDISSASSVTVSAFFACTGTDSVIFRLYDPSIGFGFPSPWVGIAGGKVVITTPAASISTVANSYADSKVHHVAVVFGSGATTLYVDGAFVDIQASPTLPVFSATTFLEVGGTAIDPGAGSLLSGIRRFNGSLAAVSVHFASLTGPEIADIANAGLTGLVGEPGTDRILRIAGYANAPIGTFDPSLTDVAVSNLAGADAWPAIEEVVATEGGIAFVDELGAIDFHNRGRSPAKTVPDLTLVANQYITPDVQPVDDDQQIINYMETTSTGTGVLQVARDTVSELGDGTATRPGHGRYSDSRTYLTTTDQESLDRANWIISKFSEPTTRYGTLTINLYAMPAALAAQVLAAVNINTWLRITSLASQNTGGTTVDVVVQGFVEEASSDSWLLRCNVVSRSVYTALILDDPTFGALDSYPLFY